MAIVGVIKYDGSPDILAWKYPREDLGTWSQLIVNESQEAVLFKGGKALDVFGSGTHTLETANIPILNNIINLPFGGRSPFTAEVWYINKVYSLDIKWGTGTPIQLQDPKYGLFAPVRSHGQFGIKIEDSKKFLVKLVGTLPAFDKETLVKYFRGLYVTKIKDTISSYLVHKQISILEINAYLDELSEFMKKRVQPTLEEYGIELASFYVNDISVPEDDLGVKKLKEALAKRAEMNIIGYNYQQERSFDTLEGAATNPGSVSSGLVGAGIGLGIGTNIGGNIGNQFGVLVNELNTKSLKECPNCHVDIDMNSRFCPSCGLDTKKDEKSSNAIKCLGCNSILHEDTKFCPECGKKYYPCPDCKSDREDISATCSNCGYEKLESCSNCGNDISSKKLKFCPECGVSLVKKCPSCNTTIEGNIKFCPECGGKL